MTKKEEFATLKNISVEAIRYGVTVTPEVEEVKFASVKGTEPSKGDSVYLVFYNDSAWKLVRDLRAVLKSQGQDTPEFPAEHRPGSGQMLAGLSDKNLMVSVTDARVRKRESGVIFKGGEFDVDLSLVPALKEAREKIELARKALVDMEASYADTVTQLFEGKLESDNVEPSSKEEVDVGDPEVEGNDAEVRDEPDATPVQDTESSGDPSHEDVSTDPDNSTEQEDVRDEADTSSPEEPANQAAEAEEVTFGEEADDDVTPTEMDLELNEKQPEEATASEEDQDKLKEVKADESAKEVNDEKAKVESDNEPTATTPRPRPRPRLRARASSGPSGPRP